MKPAYLMALRKQLNFWLAPGKEKERGGKEKGEIAPHRTELNQTEPRHTEQPNRTELKPSSTYLGTCLRLCFRRVPTPKH